MPAPAQTTDVARLAIETLAAQVVVSGLRTAAAGLAPAVFGANRNYQRSPVTPQMMLRDELMRLPGRFARERIGGRSVGDAVVIAALRSTSRVAGWGWRQAMRAMR